MSINFNNKGIPKIYQGSNLVYGNTNSESEPEIIQDGLILHYDFKGKSNEDDNKDIIEDLSGNGNHGTLHNFNFNGNSGYTKEGLEFDGSNDEIKFNDIIFHPYEDWTIQLLITQKGSSYSYPVGDGNNDDWYDMRNALYLSENREYWYIKDDYETFLELESSKEYQSDAVTVKHTNDTYYIYVNGESAEQELLSTNITDTIFNNLGKANSREGGNLEGVISSFLIYDRALSHEEIKHNHNGNIGLTPQKAILIGNTNIARIMQGNELVWGDAYFPPVENLYARPDDLLLWYDFTRNTNESSGRATIKDLSGNGNNGVLHNFNFNEESGYVENGLRFDGVNDFLTFNEFIFAPEDDFTIEIRMEEIVGNPRVDMNTTPDSIYDELVMDSSGLTFRVRGSNAQISREEGINHLVLSRGDKTVNIFNNSSSGSSVTWDFERRYGSIGRNSPISIFEGVISSIKIYRSALNDAEIKHNYYINNGLNSVLTEETIREVVPFRAEIVYDDTKEIGLEEITQEGVNGEVDITYSIVHIDGEEIDRAEKFRDTISETMNEIKVIGDKGRVVYGEGSTIIDLSAFDGAGLTGDIRIADSVTWIDLYAFRDNQINSVVIPNSVTSIGSSAFQNNKLTSVVIPDSVTTINNFIFRDNQLTSVVIPDSVTSIGNYAFDSNQITSVAIPDSVASINGNAFSNNQLTSVVIPNSVTTIEGSSFQNNQLTSVVIPDSITSIESFAFDNNQITSVYIPDSVTSIGSYAFSNNEGIEVSIGANTTYELSSFPDSAVITVRD